MLVSELLYESIILEHLGNLAQLKVGAMINILKQTGHMGSGSGKRASGPSTSPIGRRFGNSYSGSEIGASSKIVDVGVIKDGIKGLRQAFKKHSEAKAFALYVGGHAVAFGSFDAHDLGGQARGGLFAYDLTSLESEVNKEHEANLAKHKTQSWTTPPTRLATSSFHRKMPEGTLVYADVADKDEFIKGLLKLVRAEKYGAVKASIMLAKKDGHKLPEFDSIIKSVEHSEKIENQDRYISRWDRERDEVKNYQGKITSTGEFMHFLTRLIVLADKKPITAKLVVRDPDLYQLRVDRNKRRPAELSTQQSLEDLKIRLTKFKLAKKPTVNSIHEFIDEAKKKVLKVVQFDGRSWSTIPKKTWDSDKIAPEDLLAGRSFKLRYSTKDPGAYESIYITYKFDPSTSTIAPINAEWSGKKVTLGKE